MVGRYFKFKLGENAMCEVIVVTSGKGGVGKKYTSFFSGSVSIRHAISMLETLLMVSISSISCSGVREKCGCH